MDFKENKYWFLLIFLFINFIIIPKVNGKPIYKKEIRHFVKYVDTRIGVIDHNKNQCVIGPQLPFGSINPSPETPDGGDDGYAPGKPIRGFGQLHVSGTGWGKYGHFLVSPQVGLKFGEKEHDSSISGEVATASYYKVDLDRYGITAEVTPTSHCAMYRFTFPKTDSTFVLMDVTHSLTKDIATYIGGTVFSNSVAIDSISKDQIWGMIKYEGGFGQGAYNLHFYASFSKKPSQCGVWKNKKLQYGIYSTSLSDKQDRIGCFLKFDNPENSPILMKIAISFKSIEKAKEYIANEIKGWNFESVKQAGDLKWDTALSNILLEGATAKQNKMFYTALYHSMVMPRDRTGDFREWKDNEQIWDDQFAIWDTWRTVFPLMVLINPEMVKGNISSFINRWEHNHQVKDAFIAGIDMYAEQGGNNVDNVIADAILKGVQGIDIKKAYEVLKYNADHERNGFQGMSQNTPYDSISGMYKKRGWIPGSKMSCSITLEYAYNDFCIAEVAKKLGHKDDYDKYIKRSKLWINLWNSNIESNGYKGFICPKTVDEKWIPIDFTHRWGSWKNYFYEANSWSYSFFVPHQIDKLIELNGGEKLFVKKLDFAFRNELIELANEPSFLTVRLFDAAGRPDINSYWVDYIMNNLYSETSLPGNDDSGAMSSWYVFSAMGFFPNAGQETYFLNAPFCKKIIIQRSEGKDIIINAPNASPKNIYMKSIKINGKRLKKPWFYHHSIKDGAVLDYDLTNKPQSTIN